MLLHISAFLLAAGITLVLVQLCVRASNLFRSRSYTPHRKQNQELIAPQIVLPQLIPSKAAERLAAFWDLASPRHHAAIAAQNDYHAAVVRATACILIAFSALVLSSTPLKEWEQIEAVLVWIDVIALVMVLISFLRSVRANHQWMKQRTEVELFRQHQFIAMLFPDATAH